jgi:hypothetical protein
MCVLIYYAMLCYAMKGHSLRFLCPALPCCAVLCNTGLLSDGAVHVGVGRKANGEDGDEHYINYIYIIYIIYIILLVLYVYTYMYTVRDILTKFEINIIY